MQQRRHGRHARAADRRGLGHELVRLDEDARRPRQRAPQEARRRPVEPRYIHTVRGVGFRFSSPDEVDVSLRLQLLAAFAYVLLLDPDRARDPARAQPRPPGRRGGAERGGGAGVIVAANASGSMSDRAQLQRARRAGGARARRPRDRRRPARRLLADSAGRPRRARSRTQSRPEIALALPGPRAQGERHSDTLGEDLLYTAVPVTSRAAPSARSA